MLEVVKLTLENEMDLVLAHKKASRLGERLKLAISTYTTFSTAVSEVSREVIDRTDSGFLIMGLTREDLRYSLTAMIRYDKSVSILNSESGYQNAQRLLPQISRYKEDNYEVILLKIGLPRSSNITPEKIKALALFFENEAPYTAYEAIKLRNLQLHEKAEEKEGELQLEKHNNQQKNEFISIASHELKTPVTIIKAYAQMALAAGEEHCSTLVKNYLARIESQSVKLTSLIQQLLDVSKIESGRIDYKMESVDFNTFLEESLSLIKHTVPAHPIKSQPGNSASVKIDKLRIEQVLSNIIGNAAKYSSPGSFIEIKSILQDEHVVITVKDNGIGMSKKNLDKIFEKFYRNADVVQKYAGLGMGLYISSKIIKEHGGDIWVESTEGKGSLFHFSIPYEAA